MLNTLLGFFLGFLSFPIILFFILDWADKKHHYTPPDSIDHQDYLSKH